MKLMPAYVALLMLISASSVASAATIGFETKADGSATVTGNLVGADYSALGVSFSNAYYFDCPGTCPDPASGKFISGFLTAKGFTATFTSPVNSVSFNNIGGLSVIEYLVYDINGSTLGGGSSSSFPSPTTLSFTGIKSISFFPSVVGHVGANYGGIDNLTFASQTIGSSVPEPSSWAMILLGFGSIGGALRASRKRHRGSALEAA